MKATVEGADGTKGSVYRWTGEEAGRVFMTNPCVKFGEEIGYHVQFLKPMKSQSDAYEKAAAADSGMAVSWEFYEMADTDSFFCEMTETPSSIGSVPGSRGFPHAG
jgi:hypothetical protein